MSKEEILKEYSKKFSIANFTWTGELDAIKSRKILKSFLSQAIDQTREETIREIRLQDRDELIKMLPTKWEEIGFSECMGIVKQLIQDYYNK